MCTLLLTSNPYHISKAFNTPAFVSRASKNSPGTLWALDFTKTQDQDLIIGTKIRAQGFDPDSEPDDVMGQARLYLLHMHSPTGDTWREHPASKQINNVEMGYEISAHLWHNGQVINTPNGVWDTSDLLDNLIHDVAFAGTSRSQFVDEMGGLIKWDYLDEVEGSFAGALFINVKPIDSEGVDTPSESRLYVFRNNMSPLIARTPMTMEPCQRSPRLTDPIYMDETSYISSVPLVGDESNSKWSKVPSNVIFRVDLHSHSELNEPIFTLAAARLINNTYNPYGV